MTMPRPPLALCLALVATTLAGCELRLEALTPPPQGRTASLDARDDRVDLSAGVALAIGCSAPGSGPCTDLAVESDDPRVAEVRLAHRAELQHAAEGPQPAAAFVVVGRGAGSTHITVEAAEGSERVRVEVVAP